MPILHADDLQETGFLELIKDHTWPQEALLMAFTPAEFRFARFELDTKFLAQTEQGRIFSESGELRWRKMEKILQVVYLGDPPSPPNLSDFSTELEGLTPSVRRQFLLWGVRTNLESEWLEQQVPHRFSYPIDTAQIARGRVALRVEDWADCRTEIPRFSRYHSIVETNGGN